MANWRTRGAVGLTAALSLGLLISTTSGFSQADDRLPDVLTCAQFAAAAADPTGVAPAAAVTVQVPAATLCELTGVTLTGDVVVQPGGALSLTSSTVAGVVTADAAARLRLTDVAVAGAISSTGAGTVVGPEFTPAAPSPDGGTAAEVPAEPPVEPVVGPVVELTRVDAESTIDLTGTVGTVVVAGTDLLGHLALTDTTGDLQFTSVERRPADDGTVPTDPQTGPVAADPATADGPSAADAPATDAPATAGTDTPDSATGAASADPTDPQVEVPPVRNLVGADLLLTRTSGTILIDGTTVTGRVRLEGNAAAVQFGPAATVGGGVVEIPVAPDTTAQVPTTTAPTTAPTTPTGPADVEQSNPVDEPTDSSSDSPTTEDVDGSTGDNPSDSDNPTTGDDPTTTAELTTGSAPAPSAEAPSAPLPSTEAAERPGSDPAPATDPGTGSTTSARPALPDGLTVDFGSSLVDLGSLRPVQGILTADGSISPVALTDTRSGAPGWSVSAQLTDFAGGNRSFGAGNLGWTPKILDGGTGAEVGPTVAPGGTGLSVNRRLGSAAPGEGSGTTVLGADLRLQLLDPVDPGTYTATLVITVLS